MAHAPKFKSPPVVETVLSVQFERLAGLKSVHFEPLWKKFRKEFPIAEDWPPLPPTVEVFGPHPGFSFDPSQRWNVLPAAPLPRLLLRKRPSTHPIREVIQIQADRFIHNWARSDIKRAGYPSYRNNRTDFLHALKKLGRFSSDHGLGPIKPIMSEVTYINRIPLPKKGDQAQIFEACFPGLSFRHSDNFLPAAESTIIDRSFPIGEYGRLQALISSPVELNDGSWVVDFRLWARVGLPQGNEAVEDMLDLGHEWVVNGFKSLTSSGMHKIWELQND